MLAWDCVCNNYEPEPIRVSSSLMIVDLRGSSAGLSDFNNRQSSIINRQSLIVNR